MKQRVIVTGGAGFIGSYVVNALIDNEYDVLVLDNLSTGKKSNINEKAVLKICDIRDYESIAYIFKKDDIVFHLAALVSVPKSIEDPLLSNEINIRGTYNVLEAARAAGARGVIISSSAAVYGNQEGAVTEDTPTSPQTPYALQKKMKEDLGRLYAELYSLPVIALRYFNVYGPLHHEEGSYAPVIAKFLKQKREGVPFTLVGDGMQTRDFIHVRDVAQANIKSIPYLDKKLFSICNVASNTAVTVKEIAKMIDSSRECAYLPPRIEVKHSQGDNTKIKNELGWSPTITLAHGIEELL